MTETSQSRKTVGADVVGQRAEPLHRIPTPFEGQLQPQLLHFLSVPCRVPRRE